MEIKAIQKQIRISSQKLRKVVYVVKKLKPQRAVEVLPHLGNKGAEVLSKVIRQAIVNAKQKGFESDNLIFKEIQINEGPKLKRGQPVSRGRWHRILKPLSHIRIVLQTVDSMQSKSKTKKEKENLSVVGKKVDRQLKKTKKILIKSQKTVSTAERSKHGTKS